MAALRYGGPVPFSRCALGLTVKMCPVFLQLNVLGYFSTREKPPLTFTSGTAPGCPPNKILVTALSNGNQRAARTIEICDDEV